jgi:hypothetical protein
MGWCGGTTILDAVFEVMVEKPTDTGAILRALITALEDADCDTLDESWYSDHPMMRNAMIDLHPEYCDDGGGDA